MKKVFFIALFIPFFISGCAWSCLGGMPPERLLWSKTNYTADMVQDELVKCNKAIDKTRDDQLEQFDKCMLNKDFIFNDNVPDYSCRVCEKDLFKNTPACKSRSTKTVIRNFLL